MRYQRGFVALDVKIALILGLVLGALFISAVVRPLYAYKEASDIQRAVDVISQGAARYYSEQILTTGCLAYSGTVDVARLVAGRLLTAGGWYWQTVLSESSMCSGRVATPARPGSKQQSRSHHPMPLPV